MSITPVSCRFTYRQEKNGKSVRKPTRHEGSRQEERCANRQVLSNCLTEPVPRLLDRFVLQLKPASDLQSAMISAESPQNQERPDCKTRTQCWFRDQFRCTKS